MSSRSIHRRSAGSTPPLVDRGERNNQTFSKIIRVALATLGTIASYAFLPPIGATIVSSILIIATILSLLGSRQRPTISSPVIVGPSPAPTPVVVIGTPWYSRYVPRRSWFYQSPTPSPVIRRDHRIILIDHEWEQMGSPSFDYWRTMGRPSFAEWQRRTPTPRRASVRDIASASAPRVPAGTGGRTPSEATTPRSGLSSYLPTSLWPSGSSSQSSARRAERPTGRVSFPSSSPRTPSGSRIVAGSGKRR